jgi:hypothetical protein
MSVSVSEEWGIPKMSPVLPSAVIEALRSAGATEEIIAAAVKAAGNSPIPSRSGLAGGARSCGPPARLQGEPASA